MSTSEYGYRIVLDGAMISNPGDSLDSFSTRSVMSNLNHYADESAQVRCVMAGTLPALSGKAGYLTTGTPTVVSQPYAITSATFPISVRTLGGSYKMRIRIAGSSTNAAATAIFKAVLSAGRDAPTAVSDSTDAVFFTAGTTSTTAAWLTGVSKGIGAYTTMMEMDAAQVAACMTDFATVVDLGGNPVTVAVPWVTLTIFGSTTNVSYVPRLYNVYAAEVIGLT